MRKSSGVKENYKSKNWKDYKNMPQDLKFTKNKTMELVLNEPVMLAPGNLKSLQMCLHQQHYWRNNKKIL